MNKNLEDLFFKNMKNINLSGKKAIAVATSGGKDSTALTFLLNNWCKIHKISLTAITIDHNLRKESSQEAKTTAKLLAQHKISHHILKWEGIKPKANIQNKARKARYELLTNFCKENKIEDLFVAHHKEDLAETFLINLERGSGLDGLSAIKMISTKNNIKIIRPLLNISQTQLIEYLKQKNIKWINDPSNSNEKYKRVKIRNIIGSDNLLIDRINIAANHLRMVKNFVDKKILETQKNIVKIYDFGVTSIDIEQLFKLDEFESMTIITQILQKTGGNIYKPRYKNLSLLIIDLQNKEFKSKTFMNCQIQLHKNHLLISKEPKIIQKIESKGNKEIIFDSRFHITLPDILILEKITIEALGKKNWQMLDKSNIILNEELKIMPKDIFYSFPVFKHLEKVIFIPYLNYSADDMGLKIKCNLITANS